MTALREALPPSAQANDGAPGSPGACLLARLAIPAATFDRAATELRLHPTVPVADGVGSWTMGCLWSKQSGGAIAACDAFGPAGAELIDHVGRLVDLSQLESAWLFVAVDGGYVRPHKDWVDGVARFTRLHIPVSSDENSFSSEGAIVYRMQKGDIWYLDGGRTHSGACFGPDPRVHLVLDFPPVAPASLLTPAASPQCRRPEPIARPPMTDRERAVIAGLAGLIGPRTFGGVVGILGALHFRRQVSCEAMYDWLDQICADSASDDLRARSAALRRASIGPPG